MFTQYVRRFFMLAGALLMATSAFAQSAPSVIAEAQPWPRAHIVGRGGMTFATRTAPLAGAEIGGAITPFLEAYGSLDWHHDVSPDWVEDLSGLVSAIAGTDVNYRFPTFTGIGGVKVMAPRGTVRPYGLGGFGFGRVNGTVEVEGEDVTGLLQGLGFLDRDDVTFNKPLFEIGGGIAASTGRLYLDIAIAFESSFRRATESTCQGSTPVLALAFDPFGNVSDACGGASVPPHAVLRRNCAASMSRND